MAEPLFRLEGVNLSRGGEPVLRGVDAELPAGASAIVGPSGSGKSSLLRLLNRLSDPDAGRVLLHGEALEALDVLELRRRVAFVAQLPALLDGTVRHNVCIGAGLAGRTAEPLRLLRDVGLDPVLAEREVERLSVGQQQRVMLARALALSPEVLLLDEPTSALDAASREEVESTLQHLRRRAGLSFVLVTHDPEQARRLASWAVRIDDGRAIDQGPIDRVLATVP